MTEDTYQRSIQRLRQLRIAQGLTLKEVEHRSAGRWKAIVVGSYERGTRKLSLEKAIELCAFYGADIAILGIGSERSPVQARTIIDLKALRTSMAQGDPLTLSVAKLARWILARRDDWNGEVLSIRDSDLVQLQIFTEKGANELAAALELRKLLFKARR